MSHTMEVIERTQNAGDDTKRCENHNAFDTAHVSSVLSYRLQTTQGCRKAASLWSRFADEYCWPLVQRRRVAEHTASLRRDV